MGTVVRQKKFQRSSVKPNNVGCNGQLNSGSPHQQTRKNPLGGDVCSLVEDHDLCHHYQITLKPDTFTGSQNVMASLLSRSNPVQSTEWSPHPQVFNRSKWFNPHVELFATRLNHKIPLYVSPVTEQNAWDIDALNITSRVSLLMLMPPMTLLHKVIQNQAIYLPDHCNSPRFWDLVQLLTDIPLQLLVLTTLLKQSHNFVLHSKPQHVNLSTWCLGVDSSKKKTPLWRWQRELLLLKGHQQGPPTSQVGPV